MIILLSLALMAEDIPEYGAGDCKAKPVAHLVGRYATAARVKWAKARSGAKVVRKYRQGMAVTADYRTDRLNIETSRSNIIRRVSCG